MESSLDKISIDILMKELNCSVCLLHMDECFVTRCGHSYCKNCISEAINRHHKCPLCQSELKEGDAAKNHALEKLKSIIETERKNSTHQYYNKIKQDLGIKDGQDQQLEKMFVEQLNSFVVFYRKHLNEIKEQFEKTKIQIHENAGDILDEKLKDSLARLDQQYYEVQEMLVDQLSKSLANVFPDPQSLDRVCDIFLPQSDITLKKLSMKPSIKIEDIQAEIPSRLNLMNEPVTHFNNDMGYFIVIPSALKEVYSSDLYKTVKIETYKDLDDYLKTFEGKKDISIIEGKSKDLLFAHKVKQGSLLLYVGDYKLKKDCPPECLTYKYEKGKVTNYYSCENCGYNCKKGERKQLEKKT